MKGKNAVHFKNVMLTKQKKPTLIYISRFKMKNLVIRALISFDIKSSHI